MQKEELAMNLIGAVVVHSTKGYGTIVAAEAEPDYVSITIDFGGDRRTFSVFIAVENKILVFPDENIYGILEQLKTIYTKEQATKREVMVSTDPNEEKIKSLAKKLSEGKSISLDLIEAYDQDSFENTLFAVGSALFLRRMRGWRLNEIELYTIIVHMSYIALKEYDGNFHEKFFVSVAENCNSDLDQNSVLKTVYEVINDLRLRRLVHYFDTKSYVAVPLCIACVPHYRMEHLFRIAYDIFKKKLLFYDDIPDAQIAEKTRDVLLAFKRKNLIADATDDPIKGTNYLFSAYTKSCIVNGYNFDALVEIFVATIRLIINYLTKREDAYIVPAFYKEGLKAWSESFENDRIECETYAKNKSLSSPSLLMDEWKTIILKTGAYCMDETYDPQNLMICVYNGGELLQKCKLNDANDVEYNDEAIGGFKINSKKIALSNSWSPLGRLSYQLCCGDCVLYDSQDRLYRDALFFCADDGTEARPGTDHVGEVLLVVSRTENQSTLGDAALVLDRREKYVLSRIIVNNAAPYIIDETPYVFRKVKGVEFTGYPVPWIKFFSLEKKILYSIYKTVEVIVPASCEGKEIVVELDGEILNASDRREYCVYRYSQNVDKTFVYGIKIYCCEAGFHKIAFRNAVTGQYIGKKIDFIYDGIVKKINISFPQDGQTFDLVSSFLKENLSVTYTYGMQHFAAKTLIPNLGPGELRIYQSVPACSFDGESWFGITSILLYDIPLEQTCLYICGPEGMSAYYVAGGDKNGKKNLLELIKTGENSYKLPLSYLRSINDKKGKIYFEYGNCGKFLKVYRFPWIDEIGFCPSENENEFKFCAKFKAKSPVWLVVKDMDGGTISECAVHTGEIMTVKKSAISASVSSVTVGVYACSKLLFQKYNPEPLKTVRFSLPSDVIIGDESRISYLSDEKRIVARIFFSGTEQMRVRLYPSHLPLLLYEAIVRSGDEISFDVKHALFATYFLRFEPLSDQFKRIDKPQWKLAAQSKYLGKTFVINKMIFENGSEREMSKLLFSFPIRYAIQDMEIYAFGMLYMYGKELQKTSCCLKMDLDSSENETFEIFKPKYEGEKIILKRFSINKNLLLKIQFKTEETK